MKARPDVEGSGSQCGSASEAEVRSEGTERRAPASGAAQPFGLGSLRFGPWEGGPCSTPLQKYMTGARP